MRARPAGHFIAWVDDMRCKGVECMRLLAFVTAFTIRSAEGRAGDVVSQAAHEMPGRSSGPYCGLYSAGRLASLLNSPQPIDLPKYACARYVKSREGSTPTQITAILAENDIAVNGFARLSAVDLLTTNVPWIANVRRFPESTAFDHWVCVHVASDGVVVYDGAGAGQRQSLGEFLAIWNGYALVPVHERSIAVLLTSRIVLFLLAASAIATVVKWSLRRGWPLHRRIVLLACLAGVASYAGAADPLHHRLSTRIAAVPWRGRALEVVAMNEVFDITESNIQLIDARYSTDFRRGTLPGAINVPVDSGLNRVKRLTGDLNRTFPTVVFCQSRTCDFDEQVARRLLAVGFQDVRLLDGGWREYRDLSASLVHRRDFSE